jgi:hypothetical protein
LARHVSTQIDPPATTEFALLARPAVEDFPASVGCLATLGLEIFAGDGDARPVAVPRSIAVPISDEDVPVAVAAFARCVLFDIAIEPIFTGQGASHAEYGQPDERSAQRIHRTQNASV